MAKKRLNKKLIGILSLVVMAVVVVGVIVVIQYKFRDPRPFLEQAHRLIEEAKRVQVKNQAEANKIQDPKERFEKLRELNKENSDKESSDEMWREAGENLGLSMRYARGNVELRREAQNMLSDMYWHIEAYDSARSVWIRIFEQDAGNYEIKRKLVDYDYVAAKNGVTNNWPEVYAEAQTLINLSEGQGLNEPYGYVVRAHACLGMIAARLEQSPEERKAEAQELLNKALELDENNVLAYSVLGMLKDLQADEADIQELRDQIRQEAEDYFLEAISRNPDDPAAYLQYFEDHLFRRALVRYQQIRGHPSSQQREEAMLRANAFVEDKITKLLDQARQKFPQNGDFMAYAARFDVMKGRQIEGLNKAIPLYENALATDKDNVTWHLRLAGLYHTRSQQKDDDPEDLMAAFKLLWHGLYLPETTNLQGPMRTRKMQRRLAILRSLVEVCTKLASGTEGQQSQRYLTIADDSAKELRDTVGEDHPWAKVATGTVLLAKGQREDGIKYLYEADKQGDSAGRPDGSLKFKLFEALRQTEYRTLAMDYAEAGITLTPYPPNMIPHYMQTMLALKGVPIASRVLNLLQNYEDSLAQAGIESTQEKRDELTLIKAQAYLRQGRYKEAREALDQVARDDIKVRRLKVQTYETLEEGIAGMEKLLQEDYSDVSFVRPLLAHYMTKASTDPSYLEKAKDLVAKTVEVNPQDLELQQVMIMLDEPDPATVTPQRIQEIRMTVRENIADPFQRANAIATEYVAMANREANAGNQDGAQEYWQLAKSSSAQAVQVKPDDLGALSMSFDIAIATEDWAKAEELVATITQSDPYIGLLSEGHLKAARGQWDDAVDRLEEYLVQRPVSVLGHLGLGRAYAQLGQDEKAIEQVSLAVTQDSTHEMANRVLMQLLHNRNLKIGLDNLNAEQLRGIILPLDATLGRNPNDL